MSKGDAILDWSRIFTGVKPTGLIAFFVKTAALNGSYRHNPYNFEHYSLKRAKLKVGGLTMPTDGYEMDFDNGIFLETLAAVYDNVGILHKNKGIVLTKEYFKSGMFLLAWDLSPDLCAGDHTHFDTRADVGLHLSFKTGLPEGITVMVFATFNDQFTIDENLKIDTTPDFDRSSGDRVQFPKKKRK
jgi:hypothetical protein